MPDYKQSKIYKLTAGELTYYGSTTQKLHKRLYGHKTKYKRGIYISSGKLFETGFKVEIILVELYPCTCKEELRARERYYIENNECVNKSIPGRTRKEYYIDNREKRREYQKLHYIENKDKISENQAQYRIDHKDKISKYKKQYYFDNKDKKIEYQRQYRMKKKLEKLALMKKPSIDEV